MSVKRAIGIGYIKYKTRMSRGSSYTAEISGILGAFTQGGILILLINTYLHVLVPFYIVFLLWLSQRIVEYFIGWYDEKYLHWWAFETRYQQQNPDINPFQNEMMERLKRIEKMIGKQ